MSKLTNNDYMAHLNHNLQVLFEHGKIGFSTFQANDVRAKNTKYVELMWGFKNYHFVVDIPYAGRILSWDVIFDPENYGELPDFDFNDQYFLAEPDINFIAENVPSWDAWNITDPYSVINILKEFMGLFKKSQLEKLYKYDKFNHIKVQFEDLLKTFNLTTDQIEVHIETIPANDINEEYNLLNFLINLPVDLSKLPEYYQEDNEKLINPGEDFVHLHIQIKKLDESQNKVALTLSPRVEQVLEKFKLPKFTKATLTTYAQAIQQHIESQIDQICQQHNARNLFVLCIIDQFSSGIIEYDATKFYKVNFIYEELEDYSCLVTVQMGGKFPQERPKLQLNSLFCQNGRSCTMSVPFHNYEANKSEGENVESLKMVLRQSVKIFQHHKH